MIVAEKRIRKPRRNLTSKSKQVVGGDLSSNTSTTSNSAIHDLMHDDFSGNINAQLPTHDETSAEIFSKPISEKEYRLRAVHKLRLRHIPIVQISATLGISRSTVYRDLDKLKDKFQKEAGSLDSDYFTGDTMSYFKELGSMAIHVADDPKLTASVRLSAIRTALESRNSLNRYLQSMGVFDTLRYKKITGQNKVSEFDQMVQTAEALLSTEKDEYVDFKLSREDKKLLSELHSSIKDKDFIDAI